MLGGAAAEVSRRVQARAEMLELLALGPAFQFRLAGTVAAAWSAGSRAPRSGAPDSSAPDTGALDGDAAGGQREGGLAGQPARRRPGLTAALTRRLAGRASVAGHRSGRRPRHAGRPAMGNA